MSEKTADINASVFKKSQLLRNSLWLVFYCPREMSPVALFPFCLQRLMFAYKHADIREFGGAVQDVKASCEPLVPLLLICTLDKSVRLECKCDSQRLGAALPHVGIRLEMRRRGVEQVGRDWASPALWQSA